MGTPKKEYDDETLCMDIAQSNMPVAEIAEKHGLSVPQIYHIVTGYSRPELQKRVAELIDSEAKTARNLVRSRARWFIGRLIQLAGNDGHPKSYEAIVKGLELAGLATPAQAAETMREIRLILAEEDGGNGRPRRKLTGVVVSNSNSRQNMLDKNAEVEQTEDNPKANG